MSFTPTQDAQGNWVFSGVYVGAVPEPSTWALLILGFVGLMWYQWRAR